MSRDFLDQSSFQLSQHTKYADCPKENRKNLYFKHNAIKHTSAYKSDQSLFNQLDDSDTRYAYEKIRSSALWMLVGRGHLKDTDKDPPPSWILDTVTENANVVICKRKPKLQHLLMCHVTAQGMELRMQEGNAIQTRNFLDNSINEETARYVRFSKFRKRLINTSMVAKSGMVLHGIAFSKHLQLKNSECSWALDMRYQKVIGSYQSIMDQEQKDIGQCPISFFSCSIIL